MYGKPLAYVVKVGEIREIPDADRIELASVMDYTVVVKKNEFKEGDLGVYVEVDSVLPDGLAQNADLRDKLVKLTQRDGEYENWSEDQIQAAVAEIMKLHKFPYFEFLRGKKFKIKSMKLSKFGVVSQGILFRPVDLKLTDVKVGQDLTQRFEITEIVQDEEEAGLAAQYEKDGWLTKKLMRFKWFRDWRKRKKQPETWDPTHPGKSDEENVQKIYTKMYEKYKDKVWVATEKLEGQNITIFSEMEDKVSWLFFKKRVKHVGVCSRTRELKPNGTGKNFWDTVKRLGYDKIIEQIPGEWFCRGEHVGPGIQKNIYQLPRTEIYFFDFYRKAYYIDTTCGKKLKSRWVKLNYEESKEFAAKWNLPMVPLLDDNYRLPESTVNDKGVKVSGADIMLQQSDKNTCFGRNLKHKREGFVLRLKDDYNVSFKVKNPNYSI
jgi:hypothetical protein